MENEELQALAVSVYNTMIEQFEEQNLHFEKHDDDLYVALTVRGDDLPRDCTLAVRAEKQLVQFFSTLPFKVPADKMVDMALSVCHVNNMLIDGCFDLDPTEGWLRFRMTAAYHDSILGKEIFNRMLWLSTAIIDEYNNKFLMVCKGFVDFEQFVKSTAEEN